MKDKIFIDTNIIVYNFDKEEKTKKSISSEIFKKLFLSNDYVISSQVIGEFISVLINKFTPCINIIDIKKIIKNIPDDKIILLQKDDYLKALSIKERYKFSFWDSLMLATAILNGCSIVFSEDLQHNQTIETIKVINPFLGGESYETD